MVLRLLALAPLLIAATAHAQAPGEMEPVAPVEYAPSPCAYSAAREPVMAHRWAIGLAMGSLTIAPQASPDAKTQFAVGELSLRYRATPHFELELALGGGREQLSDGTQGDREINTGMLAARYRFNIEEAWNWWVMGGLGGMSVANYYASQEERKAAERPMGQLGVGIERRFRRFALQVELRAISVGQNPDQTTPLSGTVMGGGPVKSPAGTPVPPPGGNYMATDKQSGAVASIGASYYF
jgi:hypothetical protein